MRIVLKILKWIGILLTAGVATLIVSNCTMLGLNYASLETANRPATTPAITATSVADWEAARPDLLAQFEREIYGSWPDGLAISIGETRVADPEYLNGRARLEETPITLGSGDAARTFNLAIAWPTGTDTPVPVIIGQTFSQTCYTFRSTALTRADGTPCTDTEITGFAGFLVTAIFGEFIASPPIERFIDGGYAYGSFYASEIVPDRNDTALAALSAFRDSDGIASTGAIAVWSYGFSAAIDLLETDPRADTSRIAVWGHSRHGKSVLVAAAFEPRIALVFSHQSGFGGAALSRSRVGETLGGVAGVEGGFGGGYPYWFAPEIAGWIGREDALPLDQHQLLALIAPRPVLLGNGRRDVWSDPNSTYRAALGAAPVYALYGKTGPASGMKTFDPALTLSYLLRSGGHGIIAPDIDAFLDFLDAHFKAEPAEDTGLTARP